jgi:hypothetical protein
VQHTVRARAAMRRTRRSNAASGAGSQSCGGPGERGTGLQGRPLEAAHVGRAGGCRRMSERRSFPPPGTVIGWSPPYWPPNPRRSTRRALGRFPWRSARSASSAADAALIRSLAFQSAHVCLQYLHASTQPHRQRQPRRCCERLDPGERRGVGSTMLFGTGCGVCAALTRSRSGPLTS